MTDTAVTIELLDAIQDAFNRQDVDGILDHFSEDCVWVMARGPAVPEGRVCHGKAEIADVLAARYALIPDMRWVEMQHFIAADGAPRSLRMARSGHAREWTRGRLAWLRFVEISRRFGCEKRYVLEVYRGLISCPGVHFCHRSRAL